MHLWESNKIQDSTLCQILLDILQHTTAFLCRRKFNGVYCDERHTCSYTPLIFTTKQRTFVPFQQWHNYFICLLACKTPLTHIHKITIRLIWRADKIRIEFVFRIPEFIHLVFFISFSSLLFDLITTVRCGTFLSFRFLFCHSSLRYCGWQIGSDKCVCVCVYECISIIIKSSSLAIFSLILLLYEQ